LVQFSKISYWHNVNSIVLCKVILIVGEVHYRLTIVNVYTRCAYTRGGYSKMSRKAMISFDVDIRPLFRDRDVNSMKSIGGFDLSKYEDVKERSSDILERLEDGSMPCDGAWPPEQIQLFRDWIDQGYNP
jgi:hypothetical protein